MAKQRRKRAAPAFPPHPVVAVEWLDASFQDGPLSAVDFDGRGPVFRGAVLSLPHFLGDGDRLVVADHQPTDREQADAAHIPLVNVVKISRFRHK